MAVKRIGANRQKAVNEQRARMPHRLKKAGRCAGVVVLACGVLFLIYACSPIVTARVGDAIRNGKRTPADFRIVNCGRSVGERFGRALDSLACVDSNYIDRSEIFKAAAAIPEIEKIRVSKSRDNVTLIKVIERKPIAIAHDGSVCLIDKNGVRFFATLGQYYDLPLVNFGGAAGDTVNVTVFNTIKKISKSLGDDFFEQISQIDLSDDSTVNLIFKSGGTEYLLDVGGIEKGLVHLKKLTERLWDEQEEPVRIDLRYRNLAFSSM